MRKNGFFLGMALVFSLSACGPAATPSDGILVERNGQTVVIHDPVEQDQICKTHFCEPNYIVYADFARRRSPPSLLPKPVPRPTATPTPSNPGSPVSTPTPTPDGSTGGNTGDGSSSVTTGGNYTASKDYFDYAKAKMNTVAAWTFTQGSGDLIVADIDSGTNLSHPDLKANLWTNPNESSARPGYDRDGNGFANDVHGYDFYENDGNPEDENGHGTHTAGTIAAAKNDIGVIGVAPNVKIMTLRFIGPNGEGSTYGAIQAIQYAVKMGAKVISASWGGAAYSAYLAQTIQNAQAAGVVFVAAAGNEGQNLRYTPVYPALYPGVISVAATDANDQLASFSNYGVNEVMVAAPGVKIQSTHLNHGYTALSGTSMATPQVSGAIALALSKNPSMTVEQIRTQLCNTSDTISGLPVKCGRINIGRFLAGT
jgi:subtilisin family serine protease